METFAETFFAIFMGTIFAAGGLYMCYMTILGFKRVHNEPFETAGQKFEKVCGYLAFTLWTPMMIVGTFVGVMLFIEGVQSIFN